MIDALIISLNHSNDNFRLGQLSWMSEKTTRKHFDSLNHRIETLTGLSLRSSEAYQTVNYGLAGHYVPHLDAISDTRVNLI